MMLAVILRPVSSPSSLRSVVERSGHSDAAAVAEPGDVGLARGRLHRRGMWGFGLENVARPPALEGGVQVHEQLLRLLQLLTHDRAPDHPRCRAWPGRGWGWG